MASASDILSDIVPDETEQKAARARACDLPMRKDASLEDQAKPAAYKDIHKTAGGKIVNTGIYYGIGWIGNSAGSLFTTYFLNPRPDVTRAKEKAVDFIVNNVVKGASRTKTLDSVRSTVELLFMFISGLACTAIMTPLANHRGSLAHKVNKLLHRDEDVLPESMRKLPAPKTLEDKIQQEVDKRVNKKHSASDIWVSRGLGMGLILGGDYVVNRTSRFLEEAKLKDPKTFAYKVGEKVNFQSVDTLTWRLGQKLHDTLPKGIVQKWVNIFSKHGAKIEDIRKNMKEHFTRLEETELKFGAIGLPELMNENRMVIAEQTRLVAKEAGWTLVMAVMLHKFVHYFNKRRVKKEQEKAIADLTKGGYVPDGYKIAYEEGVRLEQKGKGGKEKSWAEKHATAKPKIEMAKTEVAESFVQGVEKSRTAGTEQQAAY